MAYDRMVVMNPETNEARIFNVRISDEGFADWLMNRDRLVEQGFPDRPPDVDTPTLRFWVQHPGEEKLPYFADAPKRQSYLDPNLIDYPVYIAHWHALDVAVRIALYVNDHGPWRIEMHASGAGVNTIPFAKMPISWQVAGEDAAGGRRARVRTGGGFWADFERVMALINGSRDWGAGEPYVTTYVDFVEAEAEIMLAEADAARGFPSPLPEGQA